MGNQGIQWRIILKCVLKIGYKGVDWIRLAQDRDQTQTVPILKFYNIITRNQKCSVVYEVTWVF